MTMTILKITTATAPLGGIVPPPSADAPTPRGVLIARPLVALAPAGHERATARTRR
jgi:hypothetical protein